ncbi:hypothetical protein [Fictibacillus sp. FJAT-27399]|uniref:hypothetical protein n=1 Tax=Fictibacillus sp. FJAT-27399 TaxID=1729689 RepID=UPI0012E3B8C2|nr:hypothetical protein [Fictibacillus sp. FJAT-27399]
MLLLGVLISVPGCSLSTGRAVSLLLRRRLWVSPVPLLPQESRTFHSNQLINGVFTKMFRKQQSFSKEPYIKDFLINFLNNKFILLIILPKRVYFR